MCIQQTQQKQSQMEPETHNTAHSNNCPTFSVDKYRKVHLQDLPEYKGWRQDHLHSPITDQKILDFLASDKESYGGSRATPKFETYCFKDTSNKTSRGQYEYNNFFGAFFEAYNVHGNILLVPDDIWLAILIFLTKYIDSNSEKLRSQFVMHEKKKELHVQEYASSVEESLKMEKQWDNFFKQILPQIRENTKAGVVDALRCDFTTTTEAYELVSTAVIMGAFKKYFDYSRGIGQCGISNIYFDGTLQDWEKVSQKLKYIQRYDVDGVLKKYVEQVGVIISKFIDTYKGEPDVQWWNKMMIPDFPGSGTDYIDGWILHFFGIYEMVDFGQLPKTSISVPIKLTNDWTQTVKNLQMIAQWSSYSELDKKTFKPDIGVAIVLKEKQE